MSHTLHNISYYLLAALMVLAPLPFGSNTALAATLLAIVTAIIALLWVGGASLDRQYVRVSLYYSRYIFGCLIAVALWLFMQQTSSILSNLHHPLWELTAEKLGHDVTPSISLDRYASMSATMMWLVYGIILWLGIQMGRSNRRAKELLHLFMYSSALYAIYGLFVDITGNNQILWIDKYAYQESLTSTFINRNSYATFAGFGVLACLAILSEQVFQKDPRKKHIPIAIQFISNLFTKAPLALASLVVICAALILTHSRAGIASTLLGVASYMVIYGLNTKLRRYRKWLFTLGIGFTALITAIFSAGSDGTLDRMNTFSRDIGIRGHIYSITNHAIADNSLVGTGLGSFEGVFQMHRDPSLSLWIRDRVDHAHNTYLETALEIGIPATILLCFALLIIFIRCFQGAKTRKNNNHIPSFTCAVVILAAFHALFDFSLEMPAIAAIFCLWLGVGYSQSWSSKTHLSDHHRSQRPIAWHRITLLLYASSSLLVIASASSNLTNATIRAKHTHTLQHLQDGSPMQLTDLEAMVNDYRSQVNNDPSYGKIAQDLSLAELTLAYQYDIATDQGQTLLFEAKSDLVEGLSVRPTNSYAWLRLGYISMLLGDDPKEGENAIYMSLLTGSYEPNLIFPRIRLALILWEYLDTETQSLIEQQIRIAWDWDRKKVLKQFKTPIALKVMKHALADRPEALKLLNQ